LAAGSLVAGGGFDVFAASPRQTDSGIVRFGTARHYSVEHRVTFTNGNIDLASVELWLPVPQGIPEQAVTGLKIEPEVPVIFDKSGQVAVAKMVLTESLPAADESVTLKASYRIACRSRFTSPRALAQYPYRDYARDKKYELFLRPEKYVQVDDERIAELAKKFAGTRRPAPQIARAVYDYVIENTEFRLIDGFGGATYCLEKGCGECGDYCALFVALCRAAGVPARPVNGFWADQTNGWHCWAEFMLPTGEWVPVDPQVADRNSAQRNFYFGSMDNRRVSLCKVHDVRLPESDDGHHELDFMQTGSWWWWTNGNPEGARLPQATFHVTGKRI
jgi:transglutaminase-like putative cysteine protease